MQGELLPGQMVSLVPETAELGGAWQRDSSEVLAVYDMPCLKFFHEQLHGIKRPVFFDIGASTGSFCLLPKFLKRAVCYAFEPNPVAFKICQQNVEMNYLKRVSVHRLAFGERAGKGILKVPTKRSDSGLATLGKMLRSQKWDEIIVPIMTLDKFIRLHKIKNLDVLKIDVEGAELSVLRGGEKTIKQYWPKILLEYFARNTQQFGYEPDALKRLLASWGYKNFKQVSKRDLWIS